MKLLKLLCKPIMILISKIKWPFGKKYKIDKRLVIDDLLCGDSILTYTPKELGSFFIPSDAEHAGLYLGKERVVEAVTSEVQLNSIEQFLNGKSRLWVYRLTGINKNHDNFINELAENTIGLDYDWDFTDNNGSYYCYELVLSILSSITGYVFNKYESLFIKTYTYKSFADDKRFTLILSVRDGRVERYV